MTVDLRLGAYDSAPIYTIKTVVQQTGITPATLRAWERRYHVLLPGRSDGGYRLYSERDIATLLWLKSQVEAGVAISRAVVLLAIHHQAGEEPELSMPARVRIESSRGSVAGTARSPAVIVADLMATLMGLRESEAGALLGEAFALYSIEVVAEEILTPVLQEIGERWHLGTASILQEHFSTAFVRGRLTTLLQLYGELPASGPLAIAGSAPGDWHDVGILMVSLALLTRGWRVIYLGQNVPAEQLVRESARLRPDLVCISAATPAGVPGLEAVSAAFEQMPEPRPRLAFGGQAFTSDPQLRQRFEHLFLGASTRDLLAALNRR